MAVTVGRIEYIVGADGRVLQKESRDAAKKAGKDSGKTYSDELSKAFRERWGKASGFEKTLGAHDKKVVAQFKRLGGFTSKAYATRFEQVLRPAYQDSAKKMVAFFRKISFDGTQFDLSKIIQGGPEAEEKLRKIKDVLDELDFARRSGLADEGSLAGLNVGKFERFRKVVEETIQTENWELLTKRQLEFRDAVVDSVGALQRQLDGIKKRNEALGKSASLESQAFADEQRYLKAFNQANDDRIDGGESWLQIARQLRDIAQQAVIDEDDRADAIQRGNAATRAAQALEEDLAGIREKTAKATEDEAHGKEHIAKLVGEEIRRQKELLDGKTADVAATEETVTATKKLTEAQQKQLDKTAETEAKTRRYSEALADVRRLIGDTKAWDRLVARTGSVGAATDEARIAIDRLGTEAGPRWAVELEGLERRLLNYSEASRKAAAATQAAADAAVDAVVGVEHVGSAFRKTGDSAEDAGKKGNAFTKWLGNLGKSSDLNARAIVGIVAALGEPIAVLGGSLGPALVAVGGAATGAIAGVGALVAVFSTLNADVATLPPNLQDVAKQFGALKGTLGGLKLDVAAAAFDRMDGVFPTIQASVEGLTPVLMNLGKTVGNVFGDFATHIQPGSRAFQDLQTLIIDSAGIFQSLAGTAGRLGGALVTAFNRANPLTKKFVDYLHDLVFTFDTFVQGPGFDDWIGHSATIFASLKSLTDALGTSLNNLVTDDSVDRTAEFIDNLTAFVPHLENIIRVFGELNILSLVTQALVDLGNAFLPLAPAFDLLATALSTQLSASISGFTAVLTPLSVILSGVTFAFAGLLSVIPPPVLVALGGALAIAAAGFAAFNAVKSLTKITAQVKDLAAQLTYLVPFGAQTKVAGSKIAQGLAGIGKVGGAIGLTAAAVATLAPMLQDLYDQMTNLDGRSRDAVASNLSLKNSYDEFGKSVFGVITPLTDIDGALDNLTGAGATGMLGSLGNAFRESGTQANALSQALGALDPQMAQLAQANLPEATAQFQSWVTELGASDEQAQKMLGTMPQFSAALARGADSATGLATEQDILNLALTPTPDQVSSIASEMERLKTTTGLTADEVSGLSDQIKNFGDVQLDTRSASQQYDSAVLDLTDTLKENGFVLDDHSQKSIDNNGAIDDLIGSTKDYAAALFEQTGDQDAANQVLQSGRDQLVKMLTQYDKTGLQAGKYNDIINLIPKDVTTVINANTAPATAQIDNLVKTYNGKTVYINVKAQTGHVAGTGVNFQAAGGIATRPTMSVWGEEGPEAIVPLRRSLSRVDPSVRALSAFAQGIPHFAGGGVVGGTTKSVNVAPGAIVIQGDRAPEATATNVVNRIAQRLGG